MSIRTVRLSIAIPVFNEAATVQPLVHAVQEALHGLTVEIILVDDGSFDGTTQLIRVVDDSGIRVFFHAKNQGKGAALRTAFKHATGDIVVTQDADMEYDPKDILTLVHPILDGHADVVFGSRFHGRAQRIHLYWHRVANRWLTWLTNVLFNLDLSDMETG